MFAEVAWRRAKSFTSAMHALRFVCEYGRACDDLDVDELSADELAKHLGVARAQVFQRQAAFRTCFPEDDVLGVWAIFKPFLDASNFRHDSARKQAVYVGSLIYNPTKKRRRS
jgi:hypothetical protein